LTDAQADGLITPEEKAKLEQALADAKAAEDTAQKAVDALKALSWTGNIRELRNVVERLIILGGNTVSESDVASFVRK